MAGGTSPVNRLCSNILRKGSKEKTNFLHRHGRHDVQLTKSGQLTERLGERSCQLVVVQPPASVE